MKLRRWQQNIIDGFPSILASYKRFILKAPTGAGKTILAREIIDRFYSGKKVIVLCHRLVLLDQLQFMKRCGFDSYVLRADKDIAKAPKCLSFFTQTYQAATDTDQPLFRRRAS